MAIQQKLSVSLNGTAYQVTLHWCAPSACWVADIADQGGDPIVSGIPLVTGSPLLEQYAYLGIPGDLFVQTDFDAYAVPTFDNLGKTSHLYFVPLAA